MAFELRLQNGLSATFSLELEPGFADAAAAGKEVSVGLGSRRFEDGFYELDLEGERVADRVVLWRWRLAARDARAFSVLGYRVSASQPLVDTGCVWYFYAEQDKTAVFHPEARIPWTLRHRTSAVSGVPALLFTSRSGRNIRFMGYLDQTQESEFTGALDENRCAFSVTMKREFRGGRPALARSIEDGLYVSAEEAHWADVVQHYAAFVGARGPMRRSAAKCRTRVAGGPEPAAPPHAGDPVWSTWYSLGDALDESSVWENAAIARSLGFRTVLIDAGWNTPAGGSWAELPGPYGDYQVQSDRFPDFAGLIGRLRDELGMRTQLWMNPLALGKGSSAQKEYGHLRCVSRGTESYYLCPFCRETRERVQEIFRAVLGAWPVDGVWVDFLDAVPLDCGSTRHDHDADWGSGPSLLIRAIWEAVKSVNPDAVVELRTRHANLFTRDYADVFQVNDSPADFGINRIMSASLRCFSGGVAVKSDPTVWNRDELDRNVGKHMATMLVGGVPCLSVDLRGAADSQRSIIKAYLGFYGEHRDDMLGARFHAGGPPPRTSWHALLGTKAVYVQVFTAFSSLPRHLLEAAAGTAAPQVEELYLFNTSEENRIHLGSEALARRKPRSAEVFDPFFRAAEGGCFASRDVLSLDVPQGGMAKLTL